MPRLLNDAVARCGSRLKSHASRLLLLIVERGNGTRIGCIVPAFAADVVFW